jgi:outer membrane protein W
MRSRILMLLVALALPVSLFAQSNAVSVFVNHPTFRSTSATDPVEDVTISIKFDSKVGYGASYDRFFSPNLSAQFLAQKLRGDTKVSVSGGGASFTENAGTLDATQYDAALHWHFGTGAMKPYVGIGLGAIQGAKLNIPADATDSGTAESFSLDNKITWVADAGLDFRISPNASITVTAKYMPYSSGIGAEPGDPIQRLKLDPLTFAAGVQWRF